MTDWLSGQWEPKRESLKALASQTLATIKGMRLQPKIMTQYRRFVFQNPRTSFLRISMDSRLELAAFKGKDLFTANWSDREPVTWCQKFSADMICEFPLVVVELKTECKFCDAPQWIQSLADVTESPLRDTEGKFSKYGCGVALMFYDAIKDLVDLPQPLRQVQNAMNYSLYLKMILNLPGLLPLWHRRARLFGGTWGNVQAICRSSMYTSQII